MTYTCSLICYLSLISVNAKCYSEENLHVGHHTPSAQATPAGPSVVSGWLVGWGDVYTWIWSANVEKDSSFPSHATFKCSPSVRFALGEVKVILINNGGGEVWIKSVLINHDKANIQRECASFSPKLLCNWLWHSWPTLVLMKIKW